MSSLAKDTADKEAASETNGWIVCHPESGFIRSVIMSVRIAVIERRELLIVISVPRWLPDLINGPLTIHIPPYDTY